MGKDACGQSCEKKNVTYTSSYRVYRKIPDSLSRLFQLAHFPIVVRPSTWKDNNTVIKMNWPFMLVCFFNQINMFKLQNF